MTLGMASSNKQVTATEFEKGLTLTGVGLGTAFVALVLLFVVILLIYGGVTLFNRLVAWRARSTGSLESGANDWDELVQVKEMVAAVAAAVAVGSRHQRRSPEPLGAQLAHEGVQYAPGERWRAFGRREIMQGRQSRGGWRR